MSDSELTNMRSIDALRSYGLEEIIDCARLPTSRTSKHFDTYLYLVLKVTSHKGRLDARLRPSNTSFDIDGLNRLSLEHQQVFLSRTRQMHFGTTPEGTPSNGISTAAAVLERLPNHYVLRERECRIIIETNCDELQPETFDTGLYRVLHALANTNPSNQVQDLPITVDYSSSDVCCRAIKITGITGFDIKLRISPNDGHRTPFTPLDRRNIEQVMIGLRDKIPRRPKSEKNSFATLPVEIVRIIVESFVPAQLVVSYNVWRAKSKCKISVVTPSHHSLYGTVRPKLILLRVDKRLREIILDMMYRHTHVELGWKFSEICGTFKDSLNYTQQYFEPGFFRNVRNLTCVIEPYRREITVSCGKYPSGDVVWNVALSTELRNNIRDICYLLALRPPASITAPYSMTWISSHSRCHIGLMQGTHDIELRNGPMKKGIRVTFSADAYMYWCISEDTKEDQILEMHGKAIDAIIAPMFASNPYPNGPGDEDDDRRWPSAWT